MKKFIILLVIVFLYADENNASKKEDFLQFFLQNYQTKNENNFFGITPYKMNYFFPLSYNFNPSSNTQKKSEIKFQISLKKDLGENLLGFNEKYYFAYTQTSWWQAYAYSSPFRETNYQPEIFVDFPLRQKDFGYLRFGLLHESNGQGEGLNSRSWNRVYISTAMLENRVLITPRVWFRIPESKENDDNPDITHYLGNFDLNLAYLGKDFFISTMLRNNLNFKNNKGAIQTDIGYDLFHRGIFLHLQYFNGYGESLIDYDKAIQRLSIGFLISY